MPSSTMQLPEGYAQVGEINLKKNRRLAIILNIAAFFIAVLSFITLSSVAFSVHPGLMNASMKITVGGAIVVVVLILFLLTIHEFIHGALFWVFTRSKPVYALRLFYAYAGAPDWYIPTRQFMIIALGPLAIIGIVGLLLVLLVPESWVVLIAMMVALNTGGSIGDLLVFIHLLKVSPTCLANDTGDVVTFYERPSTIAHN